MLFEGKSVVEAYAASKRGVELFGRVGLEPKHSGLSSGPLISHNHQSTVNISRMSGVFLIIFSCRYPWRVTTFPNCFRSFASIADSTSTLKAIRIVSAGRRLPIQKCSTELPVHGASLLVFSASSFFSKFGFNPSSSAACMASSFA